MANLLGFSIPPWLEPTLNRIGAASLALGLMAAGAGMQFGSLAKGKTLAAAVLAIRHFILPLVAFGPGAPVAAGPGADRRAAGLLGPARPPRAPTCWLRAWATTAPYVAGLVTLSTLLGMLSLPFALGVLR